MPSNRLHKPAIIFRGQSCEGARSREPSERALAGKTESANESEHIGFAQRIRLIHSRNLPALGICRVGLIAQLVERSPCTGEATGSNPVESKQLFFWKKKSCIKRKQLRRKSCIKEKQPIALQLARKVV